MAIANCRTWRARSACATCATAIEGENHVFAKADGAANTNWLPKDESNPYFTYDPSQVHRLLALRARLRGSAGHLCADHRRPRLRQPRVAGHGGRLPGVGMRVLRRLRAGLPDRDADRKVRDRDRPAGAFGGDDLRLLRRRLLVQGGDARRRSRAHGACTRTARRTAAIPASRAVSPGAMRRHKERILKPMIREKITDPWREVSWEEAISHAASEFRRIQAQVRPALDRRHHLVALHQRRDLPGAEADPRAASATTTSIPAPASAIRRPATASSQTFGTSAGTQDFDSVEQTDVVIVIGANPTDRLIRCSRRG